jgi:hypothetical protein
MLNRSRVTELPRETNAAQGATPEKRERAGVRAARQTWLQHQRAASVVVILNEVKDPLRDTNSLLPGQGTPPKEPPLPKIGRGQR